MKIHKFFLLFPTYEETMNFSRTHNTDGKFNRTTINNLDRYLLLYAWTNISKYKKIFESQRSSNFIYSTSEIDPESKLYRDFKLTYKEYKLDDYTVQKYDKKNKKYEYIHIISTFNENSAVTDNKMETISGILDPFCTNQYRYLKDKYIHVLDTMLYTKYHDIFHSETIGVKDYIDQQVSHNCIFGGYDTFSVLRSVDEFELFLHIYKDTFK